MASVGLSQSPEGFFQRRGADFRDTAPEQRLYWRPHIEHSHARILEAARLAAGKGTATVLGSGVAAEIPLAELARRFDRLILVDVDGPSMVESLEQVPLELRPKVELRVMDVTSFASALMERLSDAVEASSDAREAFRRYDSLFAQLKLGNPVSLPPSDLVVSSLVLSEIPRYPFAYADRLVRAHFNAALGSWRGSEGAFQKLVSLSIEDHARLLASLCRPGGAIYYADTFARGPAYRQFSADTRAKVEAAVRPDFQRLGVAPDVARLCGAEHPIPAEAKAYERLLAAYLQAGANTFEPLLPVAEVQRQFQSRGLSALDPPQSWFWISYPCAIAEGPGAFYVNSYILRRPAR